MRIGGREETGHVSVACRVSYSADWLAARKESPHLNNIVHPFDWTFTTQYKGTPVQGSSVRCLFFTGSCSEHFKIQPTDIKINYDKLKVQEKILFFDEVVLYEDELDDNGCAKLSVKLRVMQSGFFILQRFYLRVDKTLIRVFDTRIYFEVENNFLLREYSERELTWDKLHLPRYVNSKCREKKLDFSFLQRDTDTSERDCEPLASAQLQYGETDFLNNPD